MSYTEFLEARLFGPLGLERTHYLRNGPLVPGRAEGYEVGGDGGFVNDEPLSMELPYAAGSLGASVLDLLAWQRALAAGQVVSPAGYERMTARGSLVNGDPVHYGYGLGLSEEHGLARVSHGGGINGFRAQLAHYPEADLGIAVLINSGSGRPGLLANRIARAALGMDQPAVNEIEVSRGGTPAVRRHLRSGPVAGDRPFRGRVAVRFRRAAGPGGGRRLPSGGRPLHPDRLRVRAGRRRARADPHVRRGNHPLSPGFRLSAAERFARLRLPGPCRA